MSWKKITAFLFLMIFIVGCKKGEDGSIIITLTADSSFISAGDSDFAVGCFVVSSTETQCICREDNVFQTGTGGSGDCMYIASDGNTLVDNNTKISGVEAGSHYYCSTINSGEMGSLCSDGDSYGNTLVATVEAEAGQEASEGGADGSESKYTVVFMAGGRSITKQ
ncbi:MAG: hypothetical protein GY786_06830 [Proteobacteria bacterium]|nr:hypothetical protein [Pseudomonadota bacterium]